VSLQCSIGGTVVPTMIGQIPIKVGTKIKQRSTCTIGVPDAVGYTLSELMAVSITDTTSGATLFTGFVDRMDRMPLPGSSGVTYWRIACKDNRYRADKRVWTQAEFSNLDAGDIVCFAHNQVLAAEGVTANYAQRYDHDATTWGQGTLSSTSGVSGALTLAPSGSSASYNYPSVNAFNETGAVFSNTQLSGGKVVPLPQATITRDWNDNLITSQTFFQSGGCSQAATGGKYTVTVPVSTTTNQSAMSRLDLAGTLSDFSLDLDITNPNTYNFSSNVAIHYRQTYWDSGQNTGTTAYTLWFSTISAVLFKGSNSSTSGYTLIQSTSVSLPTSFHIRLEVSGSSHKVYYNNTSTLLINATDSTYTSGNVGVGGFIFYQNPGGGGNGTFKFDNLSIVPWSLSGTWTAQSKSISAVGTVGASSISWVPNTSSGSPPATTNFDVSTNGGSTWHACTNGGVIPGCSPGTNVTGLSLLIRATIASINLTSSPELDSVQWSVVQAYASSGTRTSPSLSASSVGYVGGSSISWNQSTPVNTTALIQTSIDGGSTWQNPTSGGSIPGLSDQPALVEDSYTSDTITAGNYTSTNETGGATMTASVDDPNDRLVCTGGTNALLTWSLGAFLDGDLNLVTNQSPAGGIVFRLLDVSNFYLVMVADASASTNPGKLWILKCVAGTTTQIVSPTAIDFVRGDYHAFHIQVRGSALTAFWDGVQIATVTDTALPGGGNVGFFNNGGTAYWYQIASQGMGSNLSGISVLTKVSLTTSVNTTTPTVSTLAVTVRGPQLASGVPIPSTSFQYKATVASMIDSLSKQSGTWWTIGYDLALLFQSAQASFAPWVCSTAHGDVLVNVQPTIIYNSPLYRNTQYITGAVQVSTQVESKTGDGKTQAWNLTYPVYGAPTILLNTVAQKVGQLGIDTGCAFYWSYGTVNIAQDKVTGVILTNTDTLSFTYPGGIPYTATASSPTQIAKIAAIDGTTGIIEAFEAAPTGMLQPAADALAAARIAEYAILSTNWNFSTNRAGLTAGQLLTVFAPEFKIIGEQFLIQSCDASIQQKVDGTLLYFYDIQSVDGAAIGSWHQFFASLF